MGLVSDRRLRGRGEAEIVDRLDESVQVEVFGTFDLDCAFDMVGTDALDAGFVAQLVFDRVLAAIALHIGHGDVVGCDRCHGPSTSSTMDDKNVRARY